MWMLENAFLIPLVPTISFVVILFFGKKFIGADRVHVVGIGALGLVWILSAVAAFQWIQRVEDPPPDAVVKIEHHDDHGDAHAGDDHGDAHGGGHAGDGHGGGHSSPLIRPVISTFSQWWSNSGIDFAVGTFVDGQTVLLLMVVASISLLVHIYSTEYVKGDRRYVHYYAFLSLFTASMLFFVMAQNIVQLIVGWELVGVCSFALIGHWWEEKPNTDAALKAFLTNRVGDVGLLVGMIILWGTFNTFDIDAINTLISSDPGAHHLALLVAACCLMAAVASKSGQFPLHTWLPDAMAGPTPVSALIHAATMVVAGVRYFMKAFRSVLVRST